MELNDKELKDLWAPFEAMKPLFDLSKMSPERFKAANESMIADLVGDNPKGAPASDVDTETTNLMHALINVYSPVGRFAVYQEMFGRYPWRGVISKSDHFQSVYYLVAHECYIFEERLKILFKAMEKFAKKRNIAVDIKAVSKTVIKGHKKVFGSIVKARGVHVHQDEFAPRDIKRIGLIGTMMLGEKLGHTDSQGMWQRLERQAIREARKEWISTCEAAAVGARRLLLIAFRSTKPVWSRIADGHR